MRGGALFQYKDRNGRARYGFYSGECGYTGFDCQGCMQLYVSDRYDVLIMKALSDRDYTLYTRITKMFLTEGDRTSDDCTKGSAARFAAD